MPKDVCPALTKKVPLSALPTSRLTELRREHPHLGLVVVEDRLASNGPHIGC